MGGGRLEKFVVIQIRSWNTIKDFSSNISIITNTILLQKKFIFRSYFPILLQNILTVSAQWAMYRLNTELRIYTRNSQWLAQRHITFPYNETESPITPVLQDTPDRIQCTVQDVPFLVSVRLVQIHGMML